MKPSIDNITGMDVDLLAPNGGDARHGDAVPASLSTNGIAPGVYVLRLINGNDVKTQKIVVP